MPSLRKRMTSYLRQLSFHNEPRDKRHNINENSFVTKYLQGHIKLRDGPPIVYGKNPTDLPNYEIGLYEIGSGTITGCYSGPKGGLTTVKRIEKHLSVPDADIDFIDTTNAPEDEPPVMITRSPAREKGQPLDNTTMVIKVAGQEYCVTNRMKKRHNKSHSLGSLSEFDLEIETTKIEKRFSNFHQHQQQEQEQQQQQESEHHNNNNNKNVNNNTVLKKSAQIVDDKNKKEEYKKDKQCDDNTKNNLVDDQLKTSQNYSLAKSKSEGNPFRHNKRGKIIKVAARPNTARVIGPDTPVLHQDDSTLPDEWTKKTELAYGISDSLYDWNQITEHKNGDPIADCFGIISRNDSAILAVADGVNWGEKASIAAKSAVHGCIHYLNKTIFNDTKPFDSLTVKSDDTSTELTSLPLHSHHRITNTREIFVCLLRAFNCAHDLILENKGMLTTLTVAVVLPLKRKQPQQQQQQQQSQQQKTGGEEKLITQYVCCVCNVGDTLAYVYSQQYGLRELTKGSHDINCNRDMRDALGALGPVDGIKPELSNLTLSITTLQKGDIVMIASDGLTDNFDPNVCRFTVNQVNPIKKTNSVKQSTTATGNEGRSASFRQHALPPSGGKAENKPPIKPPRRSHHRSSTSTSSSSSSSTNLTNPESVVTGGVKPKSKLAADNQIESNPLVAHFIKENPVDTKKLPNPTTSSSSSSSKIKRQSSVTSSTSQKPLSTTSRNPKTQSLSEGYKFLRSKTTIDMRSSSQHNRQILRNEDGIPYVTPLQRYELQLLLIEDILKNGISGRESACTTARKLCENLLNFTFSITSAKRHTLEDQDLYFDNRNGLLVEISQQEKKIRRKRGLEKVQNLPGKLDHVTVVAWNVGNFRI